MPHLISWQLLSFQLWKEPNLPRFFLFTFSFLKKKFSDLSFQFLFIKHTSNFFTLKITDNTCPQYTISDLFKKKNFLTIWSITNQTSINLIILHVLLYLSFTLSNLSIYTFLDIEVMYFQQKQVFFITSCICFYIIVLWPRFLWSIVKIIILLYSYFVGLYPSMLVLSSDQSKNFLNALTILIIFIFRKNNLRIVTINIDTQ